MTPTPERPDFAAAIVFFEEQLKDHLEQDREQAAQDDPDGMVHPIYMGKMVEPYYRSAIAALRAYPALIEDLAALDVLAFSLADFDKGVISAAILIDRLRAMLRERRAR